MLNKHPGAQLLKTMGDPPVDIRFGNDQYIQCTAVTPEPNRTLPIFTSPDVPLAVRTYYEHRCVVIRVVPPCCIRPDADLLVLARSICSAARGR